MGFPKLKNKFVLAPMADVSTLPFRLLCQKYGAALTYTEQLNAMAIIRDNPRTLKLAETSKEEKLVGLQLFGRNPKILLKAALKFENHFDVIDLNFGCPSKKIVEQGYGSALLREKERVKKIVETLSKNLEKPVTVKMRSGFKKVKELLDYSKCDYIMIGRAAMNNPMIFNEINHYFRTGKEKTATKEGKVKLFLEYMGLCEKYDFVKVSNLRFTALNFCKGFNGSKELRVNLMSAKNKDKIIE